MTELTPEQLAAVERRTGPVVLAAAAGSGKTRVLSERFVRAVCDDGVEPGRILAITFTNEAAAELKRRIRALLLGRGERRAAQELDASQIGTIHSFCARIVRSHAIDVGVAPGFQTLDASQARMLMQDAWRATVDRAAASDTVIDMLAHLGTDHARHLVVDCAFQSLRSRGQRHPRIPPVPIAKAGSDEEWARGVLMALGELLAEFDRQYEEARFRRGGLDFDDLELLAGELLGDESIAAEWAERFDLLMIDEFQDSNLRQLAILTAIERSNLFTVGDEMQAIYGFRDAEPGLLRKRRLELDGEGASLALTGNFRSAAAILAAINRVFAPRVLNEFEPAVAMIAGVGGGPAVELLVVERETSEEAWGDPRLADVGGTAWRAAEALFLARRIAEIVDAGEARAGEVAVLLRARSDMPVFERALRIRGLRTVAVVGRYWEDEQVQDLLNLLRLVANPRDTVALYSVLAGPLCGLDADALALVALSARDPDVRAWDLERVADAAALDEEQRAALRSLAQHITALRDIAPVAGVTGLIERTVRLESYRDHVLSLEDGRRRMANVHKLLHLSAEWESLEGRDLRGFLDHVTSLEATDEREAPATNGDLDAVRLMTIHGAKGLEFPVVAVADLGRQPNTSIPPLLVDSPRVGIKVRPPRAENASPYFDYEKLAEERLERERAEEDRVLYVAMTRAERRLIISGAATAQDWFSAEPETAAKLAPIQWIGGTLWPGLDFGAYRQTVSEQGLDVAVSAVSPATVERLFEDLPAERTVQRARAAPPEPPASPGADVSPPEAVSYTALSELERCGFRYYLRSVLRLPERALGGERGLTGRARGQLVHVLLERTGPDAAALGGAALVAQVADELGMPVRPVEAEEVAALLSAAAATPLAARILAGEGRRELAFALTLGDELPLVEGVIDVLVKEPDGTTLVVDYKSDRIDAGDDLEQRAERDYGLQRLIYGLAALRAGAERVEVAHWFLERPEDPVVRTYHAEEAAALAAELAARITSALDAGYVVTSSPGRSLCSVCPGLGGLCSYSEDEALAGGPVTGA